MKRSFLKITPIVTLLVFLSGCASTAHFNDNPALINTHQTITTSPQRLNNNILLILTFSGGGSRASALAYGVLEELAATRMVEDKSKRLLDEVDLISSVSGGSITAAYYGLYGDGLFRDFKERFLLRDVESEMTSATLNFSNLLKLSSDTYGTGDLLDAYFDALLFYGNKLDKLLDNEGPRIQINATDLFKGGRFGFTDDQFSLICSDTSSFSVSRAVAASSAVPILFTPITLTNRSGSCDYPTPEWIKTALDKNETDLRKKQHARFLNRYLDPQTYPYIHLLDGGLSDNLGLRAIIDRIIESDGIWNTVKRYNHQKAQHIVLVVVNAASVTPSKWDRNKTNPPESAVLDASTTIPLANYNFETQQYIHNNIKIWQQQLADAQCRELQDCHKKPFYLIEVSLEEHPDHDIRERLTSIATGYSLTPEQTDELINAARTMLRNHPQFKRLKQNLQLQHHPLP
jgi:NTE family protein